MTHKERSIKIWHTTRSMTTGASMTCKRMNYMIVWMALMGIFVLGCQRADCSMLPTLTPSLEGVQVSWFGPNTLRFDLDLPDNLRIGGTFVEILLGLSPDLCPVRLRTDILVQAQVNPGSVWPFPPRKFPWTPRFTGRPTGLIRGAPRSRCQFSCDPSKHESSAMVKSRNSMFRVKRRKFHETAFSFCGNRDPTFKPQRQLIGCRSVVRPISKASFAIGRSPPT